MFGLHRENSARSLSRRSSSSQGGHDVLAVSVESLSNRIASNLLRLLEDEQITDNSELKSTYEQLKSKLLTVSPQHSRPWHDVYISALVLTIHRLHPPIMELIFCIPIWKHRTNVLSTMLTKFHSQISLQLDSALLMSHESDAIHLVDTTCSAVSSFVTQPAEMTYLDLTLAVNSQEGISDPLFKGTFDLILNQSQSVRREVEASLDSIGEDIDVYMTLIQDKLFVLTQTYHNAIKNAQSVESKVAEGQYFIIRIKKVLKSTLPQVVDKIESVMSLNESFGGLDKQFPPQLPAFVADDTSEDLNEDCVCTIIQGLSQWFMWVCDRVLYSHEEAQVLQKVIGDMSESEINESYHQTPEKDGYNGHAHIFGSFGSSDMFSSPSLKPQIYPSGQSGSNSIGSPEFRAHDTSANSLRSQLTPNRSDLVTPVSTPTHNLDSARSFSQKETPGSMHSSESKELSFLTDEMVSHAELLESNQMLFKKVQYLEAKVCELEAQLGNSCRSPNQDAQGDQNLDPINRQLAQEGTTPRRKIDFPAPNQSVEPVSVQHILETIRHLVLAVHPSSDQMPQRQKECITCESVSSVIREWVNMSSIVPEYQHEPTFSPRDPQNHSSRFCFESMSEIAKSTSNDLLQEEIQYALQLQNQNRQLTGEVDILRVRLEETIEYCQQKDMEIEKMEGMLSHLEDKLIQSSPATRESAFESNMTASDFSDVLSLRSEFFDFQNELMQLRKLRTIFSQKCQQLDESNTMIIEEAMYRKQMELSVHDLTADFRQYMSNQESFDSKINKLDVLFSKFTHIFQQFTQFSQTLDTILFGRGGNFEFKSLFESPEYRKSFADSFLKLQEAFLGIYTTPIPEENTDLSNEYLEAKSPADLRAMILSLKDALVRSESDYKRLFQAYANLENDVSEFHGALTSLQEERDSIRAAFVKKAKAVHVLRRHLQSCQSEISQLKSSVQNMRDENQTLQSSLQGSSSEKDIIMDRLNGVCLFNDQLQASKELQVMRFDSHRHQVLNLHEILSENFSILQNGKDYQQNHIDPMTPRMKERQHIFENIRSALEHLGKLCEFEKSPLEIDSLTMEKIDS